MLLPQNVKSELTKARSLNEVLHNEIKQDAGLALSERPCQFETYLYLTSTLCTHLPPECLTLLRNLNFEVNGGGVGEII